MVMPNPALTPAPLSRWTPRAIAAQLLFVPS